MLIVDFHSHPSFTIPKLFSFLPYFDDRSSFSLTYVVPSTGLVVIPGYLKVVVLKFHLVRHTDTQQEVGTSRRLHLHTSSTSQPKLIQTESDPLTLFPFLFVSRLPHVFPVTTIADLVL